MAANSNTKLFCTRCPNIFGLHDGVSRTKDLRHPSLDMIRNLLNQGFDFNPDSYLCRQCRDKSNVLVDEAKIVGMQKLLFVCST